MIGKRAVVFGYGRIGQIVFQKLTALGFESRSYAITLIKGRRSCLLCLDEARNALYKFDIVVNLLPLRATTRFYFDGPTFENFKRGSIYVNAGRGQTNQEAALIEAIRSGIIKAAALDVFESEPLSERSPLWSCPRISLTPHVAGMSPNYWMKQEELFFSNLRNFLAGAIDQMKNRLV